MVATASGIAMHVSISVRASQMDAPENAETTVRTAKAKNLNRILDREMGITISYGGRSVSGPVSSCIEIVPIRGSEQQKDRQ